MKRQTLAIADVYVPVRRRQTLNPHKVAALAESIMEKGQQAPIFVRPDGKRFVLVEGLHRLEARLSARRRSPPTSFRLVSIDPQRALRSNSSGSPHNSLPFTLASSLCLLPENRGRTRIPAPPWLKHSR